MTRKHANWLASWTELLTPRGEAPERFLFWCGVSTIAGVLRRRVYLDMGTFRWFPNFYIILVGPPGTVKKSTTIGVGARLLREIEGICIGADVTTWQSFVEEVAQAQDLFAEGDPPAGMSIEEALLEQKHTVTSALTLTISEFGTFFDPTDMAMINVLTELYDCKLDNPFVKKTKTQGSDTIMNPFVNIIAGTTPDWMRANFRGRLGGWGLSSRCIFLHCDEPERYVAYPDELWGVDYATWQEPFLADLREMSRLQGRVRLTTDARDFGREWYARHMDRKITLDRHANHNPWLSYYLARKFDHIHKLATVLSVARGNDLLVSLADMQTAATRCDQVEDELNSIFTSREAVSREGKMRQDVWEGIANGIAKADGRRLRADAVAAFTVRYMSYGEAKALIEHLLAARYLRAINELDGMYYELGERGEQAQQAQATAAAASTPVVARHYQTS